MRRLAPVLRPRSRRRLPPELRGESVSSLAQSLAFGVRDPGFAPLLQRIDQAPFHGGNEVAVCHRGDDAFQWMCSAIAGAETEVLLESYIFRDDSTGQEVLDLLCKASSRGVAVRVLADAFGSLSTRSRFWSEMRSCGCEVRLFHPAFPYFWNHFFRDHRKILVVDRRVGFTGGMNIAEEYGSPRARARGRPWRDTHARVAGPAAWELALVFSEAWHRAGGTRLDFPPLEVEPREPSDGARVLVLDSRPLRGHQESAAVLAAIVSSARRSVWITNAYFAPRALAIEILGAAARRGVDVRLLLPGTSDLPLLRHAGHGSFHALLANGVRIFEYSPAVLHAKTLVADGYVSVVGSTNLDFRSFRFNAECNLVVLDEDTASGMEAAFQEDLAGSVEIRKDSWVKRGFGHRWADAAARSLSPLL